MPPNAPARSAALPLCSSTTTTRKKQIRTCRIVTAIYIQPESLSIASWKGMADFAKRTSGQDLAELREEYRRESLSEANCDSNPISQFQKWFSEAVGASLKEPNAMCLATVSADGRPSARIVLLKGFSEDGFVFYTSYISRKGQNLETNPNAALVFFWAELERQVRIEGTVRKVAREQTEKYFGTRPRGSRLGALVSRQSEAVDSRAILEDRLHLLEKRYSETADIPVPDYWGGYCVRPDTVEFWQGRPNRLHDRIRYRRQANGVWLIDRLSP